MQNKPECSSCSSKSFLQGELAQLFEEENLVPVTSKDGGWTRLLKCKICETHWVLTWENPEGLNYGINTLNKISEDTLRLEWPTVLDQ
jgi:hypothetical protein